MHAPHATSFALAAAIGWSLLAGCDSSSGAAEHGLEAALPTDSVVVFHAPGEVRPTVDPRDPRAPDDPDVAPLYIATRDAAVNANQFVAPLPEVLKEFSALPPVVADDDLIVWVSDAGANFRWAVAVAREDVGWSRWQLLRRARAAGAPWLVVAAGSTTLGPGGRPLQGSLVVNLDADPSPETSGRLMVLWSTLGTESTTTLYLFGATASTDAGDDVARTSALHQISRPDGSATLAFETTFEVTTPDGATSTHGSATVSRWNAKGAGRSDALTAGGSLASSGIREARRSQCWRAGDHHLVWNQTVLWRADGERIPTVAGQADRCVFSEAARVVVPPVPMLPLLDQPLPGLVERQAESLDPSASGNAGG